MARQPGDTNLSLREKRKDAQIVALKAKLDAEKAAQKVKDAKLREMREKIKELRSAPKK